MEKIKRFLFSAFCLLWDCVGFMKSLYIFLFTGIRKPKIFWGYSSFYFAKKYADKRTRLWGCGWDQSGRIQGVMPFDDESLIVCSQMELKHFKRKKLINNKLHVRKAIKKSYYKTTI